MRRPPALMSLLTFGTGCAPAFAESAEKSLTICDNAPNLDKGWSIAFAERGSGHVLITFMRVRQ